MSPEQARGDPLDPRSDVFALGILLYELVTGSRLYQGTSDFAILTRIVQEDAPPPSRLRPDCPPALEAIVLRALSRTREARFATAEELQLALEELARRERWSLSSVGLARYMQGLFGGKLDAWHRARDAGKTLGQHIVECTQADAPLARARTSSSMGARFGLRRRPRLWLAFSLAGCAVLGLGAYAATQLGPRADQMPRPRQTLVTLPPVETPPTQPAEKPVIAEATATPERRPLSPARPKRVVRRPPARTENPSHPDQVKLSTGKTWNPDALLPP